jgi:TPR repeat protein
MQTKEYSYKTKDEAVSDFKIALQAIVSGNISDEILLSLEKSFDALTKKYQVHTDERTAIMKSGVSADDLPNLLAKMESITNASPTVNFLIGFIYHHGLGIQQDLTKAKEFYIKAADKGFALAQGNLGYMSFNGLEEINNTPNFPMAKKWYTEAADQNFPLAQSNLANMSFNGLEEVNNIPNYTKAKKWFLRANKHSAQSQEDLALILAENPTNKDLGLPLENCQWFAETMQSAKGDYNLSKEELLISLHQSLTKYVKAQSPEDLTNMLANMEHINIEYASFFAPVRQSTLIQSIIPSDKSQQFPRKEAYFKTYEPIYKCISSLSKREDIFYNAQAIHKKRKDLFNAVDILCSGLAYPELRNPTNPERSLRPALSLDAFLNILKYLPTPGLHIDWNNTAAGILSRAIELKGTVPQKQVGITDEDRYKKRYTNVEQYTANVEYHDSEPQTRSATSYLRGLSRERSEFFSKSTFVKIIESQRAGEAVQGVTRPSA